MMKRVCQTAIATLMITLPGSLLLAEDSVDETRDVPADVRIDITNARGEISVRTWDEARIHVEGDLDDLTEEFIFEVRGSNARIEVRIPKRNANWGDGSDLEIKVPATAQLRVEGVSTDISVDGVEGGVRLRTASGDIRATDIGGRYDIRSVSGEIEIEDAEGDGNVSNVSGEIQLRADSPSLVLDTVSGDIEAELSATERLIANAVSGDVDIITRLLDQGRIDISSVSSDVVLELFEPVDARVEIETGPGGDITNRLTDDDVENRFPAMKALKAEMGNGSGDISVRTVSGDIRLDSAD